jgi:ATP-dependent helicase HrpB
MQSLLPIESVLPTIESALAANINLVLVAEPGSGKTTRVPAACLDSQWLGGKKIILLEPRRIAAKAAAYFIASQHNFKVGKQIGFRIRGESRVSSETQLEIVTEGILTRMLQGDTALEDVGLIIFDEFHERSIHADLSLALALDLQRVLRPDLRLMVMSATIDAESTAELLGNAQVILCPGRQYNVDLRYVKSVPDRRFEIIVADTIRQAHREEQGDILVFLPGRAEIHRVAERLREVSLGDSTLILMLHSEVRGEEQDLILSPKLHDSRRIILATNIAETSLTIPRVRVVIDSGLMRAPRFDPKRGVSALDTITISQASAAQRAGRAGRQEAGVCYRLWAEHENRDQAPFTTPEILDADLASFILELAAWGDSDPAHYSFLNQPPLAHITQASELLILLGALDVQRKITTHGKHLLSLSLHPRLAHMLCRAQERGLGAVACDLISLLEEPTVLRERELDRIVSQRWDAYHSSDSLLIPGVKQRIAREAQRLKSLLNLSTNAATEQAEAFGPLIALAYPERLAQQREKQGSKYLMRAGGGALVSESSPLKKYPYLAIAHLDGLSSNARVFLAEAISIEEIEDYFSEQIGAKREIVFDQETQSVRAYEVRTLGSIALQKRSSPSSDEEAIPLLLSFIRDQGMTSIPFTAETSALRQRVQWLAQNSSDIEMLPNVSDQQLLETLEDWLAPFLLGVRRISELNKIDLEICLQSLIPRIMMKTINELAPTHIVLPTGRQAEIFYHEDRAPEVSVYLQELFGQSVTPRIAAGKVPLTLVLLSPAKRPLQVTRDLESFWKNSYQQVRKEMMGRYPKHSWPLDPLQAVPMRGVKRR